MNTGRRINTSSGAEDEKTHHSHARQLGPEGYGRLALLNVCCPDKVYRLGKGKFPDLVVDSLGDLFVIKVEMTELGVCKPTSVRWMKKESRTEGSTLSTEGALSVEK
jgi:hypothetical protein